MNNIIYHSFQVSINVWKDIGTGPQYMYSMESNLCDCLSKNDTPFYPLVQALGTTSCPVPEVRVLSISSTKNDYLPH